MFLSEPMPTRFDVHFSLMGVPIRISPFFWLMALLLGLGWAGNSAPHLVMWITAVFLSILVHELGHVWAFARYGIRSYVVLYHFGGLAVPAGDSSSFISSYDTSFRYSRGVRPPQQLVISAAGPAAELALGVLVFLAVRLAGYHLTYPFSSEVYELPFVPFWISQDAQSTPLANSALNDMAVFIVVPSIYWALFNLIPVFPLDGGQIARQLFLMFGGPNGLRNSLVLSIVAAGGMAVYGFTHGQLFLALMFGSLAFSSYQLLTTTYGGGWGGGRW